VSLPQRNPRIRGGEHVRHGNTAVLRKAILGTIRLRAAFTRPRASVFVITRNVDDFADSPVPAVTPADFLSPLEALSKR
jgi:hypothetical protein